ncbi:tRNA uridine-5-carboxymethylaminomethyl(34) synthesis GTPase MnmE [Mesorhizobium sp. CGMCC 1.15528]|uniref:tRNA modification GTPase MnmE n=1 Tax=Mesorhizobium zhangyense TaxID=1776730 RepID=A0A7C9VFY8_9HYPH|nr:tRNA uridine-5-carboxymethylaminomethyl(34) synthesis GTPase MnmE [Mesorhizobium zhangyense]NGN43810.1 tRNA uridine-5-carboxymethylaminomethyl(34) synthesis GTPase MnmE [Mesorhizobium zhangyense]
MIFQDSIVALSSGHLPSGIAIIRITGPKTRFALETINGSVPKPRFAHYGKFRSRDGSVLDSGISLFFPGPKSFTGEDSAEFHVHGGRAVVSAMMQAIGELDGFRQAEPGEFTRRAFLNGKVDLVEAEALADLVSAETEAQRRFAVLNSEGRQSELYQAWRTRLIHDRAMIEAEMDFSDESDVPGSVSSAVWADIDLMIEEIELHLQGFRKAEIIRDGYDVVIVGAPNAGKSSLLNALARRDVAIVTDEPGTTRDLVEVALELDGVKVRLTDTAGIRETSGKVELIGIEKARQKISAADAVLYLEDLGDPKRLAPDEIPSGSIRIGTKADLSGHHIEENAYDLLVSTETGEGIVALLALLSGRAVVEIGSAGDVLPSRQRHVELLGATADFLKSCRSLPTADLELRSEHLRLASDRLGRISGAVDPEDLLDVIFSQFCIGK